MANEFLIRLSKGSPVDGLGEPLTTIGAGAKDSTSTSLVLHGRGAPEYGQARDQNLVFLLENFAGSPAPKNPLDGQLWWVTSVSAGSAGELFVWDTTAGSPTDWTTLIPPPLDLGFTVEAGLGLTGGGFPTLSPLEVTLNVGAGTGITVAADSISTNDAAIDHDAMTGGSPITFANEHIDHSTLVMFAGNGMLIGSPGGNANISVAVLNQNRTINIGAGDGITLGSPSIGGTVADAVNVDGTVVRTAGIQSVAGKKTFGSQIRGTSTNDPSRPAYGFTSDTNNGLLNFNANRIGFVTAGSQRFNIGIDGVLRSNTASYENLVLHDDDIPNKKYVDDATSGAISNPTATEGNQGPGTSGFIGVSTLGGGGNPLDATQTYLVGATGITPEKGDGFQTLDNVTVRSGTSLGAGTILAQTPAKTLNWFQGRGPSHVNFIVDMSQFGGFTSLNVQFNDVSTGGNPSGDAFAIYVVAIQLTSN